MPCLIRPCFSSWPSSKRRPNPCSNRCQRTATSIPRPTACVSSFAISRPCPSISCRQRRCYASFWAVVRLAIDKDSATNQLASPPTGLTPSPNRPHPQPLSKGRGEWYALCIDCLLLANSSTNNLVNSSTPQPFVHFSNSRQLVSWSTCQLISWSTCQLVNWLTRQLTNLSTHQLPTHSSTSQTLVNSLTGQLVNWFTR